MKADFFKKREKPDARLKLSRSDPFQSDYFNQNLFQISLRNLSGVSREMKVANVVVTLKNDERDLEVTNDIREDFRRLMRSVRFYIREIGSCASVGLTKTDRKELRNVVGRAESNCRCPLGPARMFLGGFLCRVWDREEFAEVV